MIAKISILNNKKCQISGLDDKLNRKLYHHLSFKLLGAEYSAAFQNGWSGYTYLLSKHNKFNYGLLEKVKLFLDKNNTPFVIEDNRTAKVVVPELDISDNLKKYNLVPREHQVRIINEMLKTDRGIIRAATGAGKAQPLDAKILTPNGWIEMKDVVEGTFVIGSDGLPKKVLKIFPQGKKKIFKVSFSDGSSTECCEEHLWFSSNDFERKNNILGSVKSLKQIKKSFIKNNHLIPSVKPIVFNKQDITIDPYMFGSSLNKNGDMHVIPQKYLINTPDIRLSLLQGLMDSSGFYCKENNTCIFNTTSFQLANDVQFLVRSFGGNATIKSNNIDSYTVRFLLSKEIIPFKEDNKRKAYALSLKHEPKKYINNIKYIGLKDAQCILIDSEDHLYVTDNFILTHNTLCTALFTAKINKPTNIYVIGLDLLDQFYNLFSKLFDEKIGYIGNGVCDIHRINIVSIWSVGKALQLKNILDDDETNEKEIEPSHKEKILSLLAQTKVHILDESHVSTTNTLLEIYKHIDPEYLYGFSGTPFRDDNSDLLINSILGEKIIDVSASELIAKSILAPPIIRFLTVPKKTVNSVYTAAYKEYIVENDERNDLIVDAAKMLINKNYTVLALFKQIKHGKILFDRFTDENIKFDMLSGHDSLEQRNKIKQKIVNKEINLVLSSTIFDIGLDLPELNALILCGGGKSSIRALQRIGRVIRSYPGKKQAAVIDFYDQAKFFKKHSTIRYGIYTSEKGFNVIKSKEMK